MLFRRLTRSLEESLAKLARLNEEAASGRRINRPSDDATGMGRAIAFRLAIDSAEQYRRNIDQAAGFLAYVESALGSASDALVRAKELALQGATGTASADSRAALAKEARQLAEQLAAIAGSRFGDRYVFSGFRTDMPPFDQAYAYAGDDGIVNVPIDRGVLLPLNVPGSTAFGLSQEREETVTISGGRIVHYLPASGGGVAVEIRAADDATVLDRFGFDNAMQLAALLAGALEGNDSARIEALVKPLGGAVSHVNDVRAEMGGRRTRLDDQAKRQDDGAFAAREALSRTEDADMAEVASGIARADAALEALRLSSARIMSQSLLDFLD